MSASNGWCVPDEWRRVSMGRTTYYSNIYNARGEREAKSLTNGMNVQRFVYDEAGRLIQTGNVPQIGLTRTLVPEQRLLWLDDQLVGVKIKATSGAYAGELLYAHTDHLGTPRALSRPSANNSIVWRWPLETSAFGQHPAQSDPDGDGQVLTFNLRYPGQYFDAESGLHYNYFRDYEAGVGRYIESDPIGLRGGVSTYAYVKSKPIEALDATGLITTTHGHRDVNSVECDGNGGMRPFLLPLDEGNRRCGVGDCIFAHENYHLEQAMRTNPFVCLGKPEGMLVAFSNKEEQRYGELAALAAQLECLRRKLEGSKCDEYCTSVINSEIQRVHDLEEYYYGY